MSFNKPVPHAETPRPYISTIRNFMLQAESA